MSSNRKYFGTDGIRGTVGQGAITAGFMLRLGHAVGQVLKRHAPQAAVVIGKDTRVSGYMIESALEAGFVSAGVQTHLLGVLPTPGVAYMTRALRMDLGVVISASHNAFADNGIKFFSASGKKLPDAWELEVEAELDQAPVWADSASMGKAERVRDARGRYIEFCKGSFSQALSLRGLNIVVDAAHGAGYDVGPAVFHELGAQVHTIGCSPDGFNINDGVGATAPQALVEAVRAHKADYGIALDGDADRLQMVDAQGRLFNGDELLYLMAMDRLAGGRGLPGVVGTLMTNCAVENALKARGVEFVRANVGDRYVLEELDKRGWTLGGEGSGHLLVLDRHTTGDALVSALQVLQACVRSGKTMAEQLADVQMYPQTMINVPLSAQTLEWAQHPGLLREREACDRLLEGRGRVLIRKSGTEPKLRITVEADDAALARQCAERMAAALAA